jgi:prepilin-type N-terminal cleavage/methylation domain-containing protein
MKLYRVIENKFTFLKNKQGVTIVELLVVIAVIGIAMVPASQALINGMNAYATETENMERVYDAQNTLDYITDRVRFNAHKKISIVDVNSISNFPANEGVGNALMIENTAIYYNGSDQIKEYKLNEDDNYTLSILLEHANGMVFDHKEVITIETEDKGVITKESKLSRFDVAIRLEKKNYDEETFRTTVYLRNK